MTEANSNDATQELYRITEPPKRARRSKLPLLWGIGLVIPLIGGLYVAKAEPELGGGSITVDITGCTFTQRTATLQFMVTSTESDTKTQTLTWVFRDSNDQEVATSQTVVTIPTLITVRGSQTVRFEKPVDGGSCNVGSQN